MNLSSEHHHVASSDTADTPALAAMTPSGCKAMQAKVLNSEALFSGARELMIQHADEMYRLRITNQGKLILTK